MPQTNNLRDILVVEVQNSFAATLKDIRDKVLAMCGEKVWKGITCTVWGDVCLWVEPTFVGIINADSTLWFKIEEATVFPCYPGTGFPHGGVSIKASLSPPTPQTPSTIPMIQMGTGFPHGGGSINANPLTPLILSPFHQVTQMATGFPHGGGSIKANPLTPQILSPIHQVTQMATGFPHGGGSIHASPLAPQTFRLLSMWPKWAPKRFPLAVDWTELNMTRGLKKLGKSLITRNFEQSVEHL